MTAVHTLHRAAALIRERAEAATRGPWLSLDDGDRIIRDHDGPVEYVVDEPMSHAGNAAHIATWHPIIALIVADWLDAIADDAAPNAGVVGFNPNVIITGYVDAVHLAALIVGAQPVPHDRVAEARRGTCTYDFPHEYAWCGYAIHKPIAAPLRLVTPGQPYSEPSVEDWDWNAGVPDDLA